jgi:hypothetical protein
MKPYKLIRESPTHFLLHNGVAHFHIAKKGLAEPTADKIRSFAEGGKIERNEIDTEPKENKYELPPAPEADLDYKPAPTPEPDKKEERKLEMDVRTPAKMSEGGKLDTSARAHISEKNFAGPDRSYPIEDASHARNALARVSQHGSPELKAQVRAKVHAKYPGIEQSKADGGDIEKVSDDLDMYKHGMDTTKDEDVKKYENIKQLSKETGLPKFDAGGAVDAAQSVQESFRKATHYQEGGEVDSSGLWEGIKKAFNTPKPTPTPVDRDAQYEAIRKQNTANMQGDSNYAGGGYVHHNAGKNQLHFHFYDGAVIPTQLDKEEGAGPQQPSALDKYVGGEPTQMADGGEATSESSEGDKLEQAAQDIQAGLNSQTATVPAPSSEEPQPSPETAQIVPQSQQIPAVQKSLSPTPDQSPSMLSDFDKSLALEKSGIEQGAQAQSEGYKQTAQAIGQNVLEQKRQMDAYRLEADNITKQNTQLFDAVASSKIDPNHFWNSKSTGGKIMATIGVLLGGIGGGASGTPNQALATLQNHIQQDIEAQKLDQSNKMNLYKMGLERYRDAQSAQQFATLQSNALLQGQLQKIAATTGNQTAMNTAQQMIGQLGVQNAGIRSELAMKQAAFGAMNQPQPANTGIDPNKMRLLINAGVIPKEEVPTAMKEYSDYDKLGKIMDHVDDVFQTGRKQANITQFALPHWVPTMRQSTRDYDAAVDGFLGNITKETEGRVTPQDVELMRPSMPKLGDSPEVAQHKMNLVKDQIKEKYAFPTLQSYRLLHPNNPTATPAATRQKRFTEGSPK